MTTETPAATTPSDERNWLATVPDDWAGWLALRDQVNASPLDRNSFRNWLSSQLGDDQHLELGLGLAAAGEPARALPHLQAASGDLAALLASQALAATGQRGPATEAAQGLVKSKAVGLRASLDLAERAFESGDLEALEAAAKAAGAAGASEADGHHLTALQAELAGDHQGAVAAWQQALAADDKHAEATFRLAGLLDRFGDDEAALELLDRFRTGDLPLHTGALMNLGVLYEDNEQHDWALACFRMVVEADPTDLRARRYLHDAEASLDQFHDEREERKADKQNAVLRIPVTDFELSVRARNCLQRMSIHTLGDLVSRTESELLSFKNFGETSLQEVKDILAMKGLRLGMMPGSAPSPVPLGAAANAPDGDPAQINVSELDLSVRSRAALATLGITKVGDLAQTTETTLLSCKNFGQTSLDEIKSKLRGLGLELAG